MMVAVDLCADAFAMLVPLVAALILLQFGDAALLVLGVALGLRLDLNGLRLLFNPSTAVVELH